MVAIMTNEPTDDDEDDDGLSVAASVSSVDTVVLTQRIAAAKQQQPSTIAVNNNKDNPNNSIPLDDISNEKLEEEDLSKQDEEDNLSKQDEEPAEDDDSVDTATLERRILERRGKFVNAEDEFVLPDDDSSSDDDEQDEDSRTTPPLTTQSQLPSWKDQEELLKSTQAVPNSHNDITTNHESGIIPRDASIRLGLHRPPPSSRKVWKQPARTPVEDDIIEDSSSEDEATRRYRRKSLPFVASSKKSLTQQTLPFATASSAKPLSRPQKHNRKASSHTNTEFSPPRPLSPHRDASPIQNNFDCGAIFHPQRSHAHDFSIVASAYEDLPPRQSHPSQHVYEPPSVPRQTTNHQFAARQTTHHATARQTTHHQFADEYPRQKQVYNAFRRPDSTMPRQPSSHMDHDFSVVHEPPNITNRFPSLRMNHSAQELESPPLQRQDRQPDFAITASAYEDIPYQPFVPPAASRGGRRIRDPSARPKRKQSGKRRKGRSAAGGRQPVRARKKPAGASRSRSAASEPTAFRRAPDDHLSGVGGASMRF